MVWDVNYKLYAKQVSVSAKLYDFIHFLWLNEAPVGELQWALKWVSVWLGCIFASASNNTS